MNSNKKLLSVYSVVAVFALVVGGSLYVSSVVEAQTTTPFLTSQMSVGSTGDQVSKLQTFLTGDPHIYPQALVTGYYGSLTESAVTEFQLAYGISPVGRVGPLTLAEINGIAASGQPLDVTAPRPYTVSVATTTTSATIAWTTNEPSHGRVFYSTAPMSMSEANSFFALPSINGTMVGDTSTGPSGTLTAHNVQITGLQPSTLYYYVTESVDASGNTTVTPQATFITPAQ